MQLTQKISVVPSLDKLLEENLTVNVYQLARSLLEEERVNERQKRQQLEDQNEQLRLVIEQLRLDNTFYQSLLTNINSSSLQEIKNLRSKAATF